MSDVFRKYAVAAMVGFLIVVSQPHAQAALVDFNGLTEGSLGNNGYTDPMTGVKFLRRSVSPLFTTNLVAEFSGVNPNRSRTSPGIVLSGNGFVPGDGISVPPRLEIEVLLPQPSRSLSFDMIAVNAAEYNLRVLGFNDLGQLLARRLIPVEPSSFEERLIFAHFDSPVSRFVIRPIAGTSQNYDNFRFVPVPEPATVTLSSCALGLLVWGRKSLSKRSLQ